MKTLLFMVALGVAIPTVAEESNCRTVVVCDPARPPKHKKKFVKKKATPTASVIVKEEPKPSPLPVIIVKSAPKKAADRAFLAGPHFAFGLGARDPHTSGLIGVRGHYRPLRLGAEVYTALAYGLGVQALVYPYQSGDLNVQVNLGVLGFGSELLSTRDVPRPWDLTIGTGLEYKLAPQVALTLDWRASIPSFVYVANNSWAQQSVSPDGRYLNSPMVLGNALTESQVLVGILIQQ